MYKTEFSCSSVHGTSVFTIGEALGASIIATEMPLSLSRTLFQLEPRVLVRNRRKFRFPALGKSTSILTFVKLESLDARPALSYL
jgi:hypothetical protein